MRARFFRAGFALLAAISATGCIESQLEPRTPDAVLLRQPTGEDQWIAETMPTPGAEDSFWKNAQPYLEAPPPVRRAQSVSLGFIGDSPLGQGGHVHHRQPSWTRPFPASWTRSSRGSRGGGYRHYVRR